MSVLNFNGKNATPGLPCLYHLTVGMIFYSETVKEDSDSFIFDGEKTLVISIGKPNNQGQVNIAMSKLSADGFKPLQVRVMKSAVAMIQDTSEPGIIEKAHEALSGLVLPPSVN
jgi:hypothetical protein